MCLPIAFAVTNWPMDHFFVIFWKSFSGVQIQQLDNGVSSSAHCCMIDNEASGFVELLPSSIWNSLTLPLLLTHLQQPVLFSLDGPDSRNWQRCMYPLYRMNIKWCEMKHVNHVHVRFLNPGKNEVRQVHQYQGHSSWWNRAGARCLSIDCVEQQDAA